MSMLYSIQLLMTSCDGTSLVCLIFVGLNEKSSLGIFRFEFSDICHIHMNLYHAILGHILVTEPECHRMSPNLTR